MLQIFRPKTDNFTTIIMEKKNSGPLSAKVANNRYDGTRSRKAVGHGRFELRITLWQS